ncbi:MAG: hypothetical protein QOJ68_3393 [Blastococcus sp.]|jgi:hypothetical protein|nr:hypothetical protein [Blastococcus sp.]
MPAAGICLALVLAGCAGGNGRQIASGGTSVSAAASSSAPRGRAAPSGLAGPRSPVAGKCDPSTKKATIGGAEACLAAGQLCVKAQRASYPSYGLLCLPKNNRYVLVVK